MKTLYSLLVLTLFASSQVHSQISKGSVLLGGDIGFSTQKTESTTQPNQERKVNGFMFMPTAGIAVKNNLILGVNLQYASTSDKYLAQDFESSTRIAGLGVFARKYHELGKSGFYVFGQAGLGYNNAKSEHMNGSPQQRQETTRHAVSLSVQPGLSYAVSRRFHVETGLNNLLSVSYINERSEMQSGGNTSDTKSRIFLANTSIGSGSTLYLGFRVLLQKG